jgi:hypothetical protein
MSANEYAHKHAGKRIRVYVSASGPNRRLIKYPYCRVVGYNGNANVGDQYIYVELEDAALQQYCSNPNVPGNGFIRTAPQSIYAGIWQISYEDVRFLRRSKVETKQKLIKPYPHTCSKCRAPSRNCSNYVLCSNDRCSANKKFKRVVLSKIPKITRIKCPTCKRNAIEVGAARSKYNLPEWRFSCDKRHVWKYVPRENDVVSTSYHKVNDGDRIWQGNNWKTY